MSVHAQKIPQRRGACPGLSAPIQTGDGLLVRLMPIGTIPLAAFAGLCAAARQHGNGVIEITARGNVQVRGLTVASAPQFAAAVAGLDMAVADGIPILTNPLAGFAAEEILNAAALAADLRLELERRSLAARVGPKVSVAIDGGGALNLDRLAADVRLRAAVINGDVVLRVGIGGDGTGAAQLGFVELADCVEVATRLLEILARRGRDVRAGEILATEGIAAFRAAVADLLVGEPSSYTARQAGEAIGVHRLLDGSIAYGIGLGFGHSDAALLEQLAEAARWAGARGWRVAGRVLIAIGLMAEASSELAAEAERLGFIVRADDARRHVIACAGAPICASGQIASRAIASAVAEAAAPHLDSSFAVHISGCVKGCAHPAPAALTVVGTPGGCALIANGSTHDTPFAVVATDELPAAIAKYTRELKREDGHV